MTMAYQHNSFVVIHVFNSSVCASLRIVQLFMPLRTDSDATVLLATALQTQLVET